MKHSLAQQAFLKALDSTPGRWTEVLPNEHQTAKALERKGLIRLRQIDPRHWEAQPS